MSVFKKIWNTLKSCVLCIRYPFLYPRNRWSGAHYTNWKLDKKIDEHASVTSADSKLKNRIVLGGLRAWRCVLRVVHCLPTYTELDAFKYGMPGWYKAFGLSFLNELRGQLIKEKFLYGFRIMDWKEKFGEMRFYCGPASDECYRIIDKYTELSARTCIVCGKPAKYITTGYILPYCEDHLDKYHRDCGAYEPID